MVCGISWHSMLEMPLLSWRRSQRSRALQSAAKKSLAVSSDLRITAQQASSDSRPRREQATGDQGRHGCVNETPGEGTSR